MPAIRKPGPGRVAFEDATRTLGGTIAKVGFFESAKYPDAKSTPIAYVAAIMENGAPSQSIPPRPFFRPTIEDKRVAWQNLMAQGAKAIVNGRRTAQEVFEGVGLQAAGDVRQTISTLTDPPLSKLTILARKFKKEGGTISGAGTIGMLAKQLAANPDMDLSGVSTKPLNDTGALLAHLTNTVEESGK